MDNFQLKETMEKLKKEKEEVIYKLKKYGSHGDNYWKLIGNLVDIEIEMESLSNG